MSDDEREKKASAEQKREAERIESDIALRKIEGYFPTPASIVEQLIEAAEIECDHAVLEPSAGCGDIAQAVDAVPCGIVACVEINPEMCQVLESKGFAVECGDFLNETPTPEFDRVVMNPPFERDGDIQHVMHAFRFLKPGGRLVAIMSEGPFFRTGTRSKDFRKWLEHHKGTSEQLPDDAFSRPDAKRKTKIRTRLVVVDKEPS